MQIFKGLVSQSIFYFYRGSNSYGITRYAEYQYFTLITHQFTRWCVYFFLRLLWLYLSRERKKILIVLWCILYTSCIFPCRNLAFSRLLHSERQRG